MPGPARTGHLVAAGAGGWVLAASGLVLPWTHNRMSGDRWLFELAERHPIVVSIYVNALLVLLVAAVVAALPAPPVVPATLAASALILMVVLTLVTPLPATTFTGADGRGRPVGGSVESTLSFGPAAAGVGAAVVLAATVLLARLRSRP